MGVVILFAVYFWLFCIEVEIAHAKFVRSCSLSNTFYALSFRSDMT